MDEDDRILHVIGLIYEAAVEPSRWPVALQGLSSLVGATASTLLFGDARSAEASIMQAANIDPQVMARYNEYYVKHDVRLHVALRRPLPAITTNSNVPAALRFGSSEFFNDFLSPSDLVYMLGTILVRDDHAFASLGVHRSRRGGEYTEDELRRFRMIVPHLQRAIEVHRRLYRATLNAAAAGSSLDRLAIGVILVDAAGRVLFANRSASEITVSSDGLMVTPEGLRCSQPDETKQLRRLVAAAAQDVADVGGSALAVSRPSLKRALSVLVAPLRPAEPSLELRRAAVVVFVSDPERSLTTTSDALQRLYSLTAAEARLAKLLLDGHDLRDAAGELGISVLTARTQLKSVFHKTETRRQSELIRIMMAGLGQLRSEQA
jgi:DNA-binding CsgD family transcriptional regulator/PAS domain-containing protein